MLERLFGLLGSDLAIDLGTANTLIGVAGEGSGGRRTFGRGRRGRDDARRRRRPRRWPSGQANARPHARLDLGRAAAVGRRDHRLRAVRGDAALLLQQGAARRWSRGPRVLVAVPGSITPVEKRAVYNSAHRAGARQVFLVSEAIAAAVGAGLPITEPVASMICDVGGGTTEVAVLSLGDVVAQTSVRVGGDRMDQAILDYLRRHHNLRIGLATAEQLRDRHRQRRAAGRRIVDRSARRRRHDRPAATTRRCRATKCARRWPRRWTTFSTRIKTTLDGCSPDLAADLVDHGVGIVGGAALLRQFDVLLSERIGLPVRILPAEPLRPWPPAC